MSDINVNNDYTKMNNLTPFKLCVLQNFPFIEADFDVVTNYQLLCKVVEYLNNVIDNNNKQNSNITQLEQNFITLYNYVKDYFDNLDVQEEINNKLDEMAESGSLEILITDYFNKVSDSLSMLATKNFNDKVVIIGDSWGAEPKKENSWVYALQDFFGNGSYAIARYGSGFTGDGNLKWLNMLEELNVTNKNEITKIIICGGWNDYNKTEDEIITAITEFANYVKNNFINAVIFLGYIANGRYTNKNGYISTTYNSYLKAGKLNNFVWLKNTAYILTDDLYKYFPNENTFHPTEEGYIKIRDSILYIFKTNNNFNVYATGYAHYLPAAGVSANNDNIFYQILNNDYITLVLTLNFEFNFTESVKIEIGGYDVGSINSGFMSGLYNVNNNRLSGYGYVKYDDNTVEYMQINLLWSDSTLKVEPLQAIARKYGTLVKQIGIDTLIATIPTINT